MVEWFLLTSSIPGVVAGVMILSRVINARIRPKPWVTSAALLSSGEYILTPPKISPAIRAELDQTPEWWDKQFHDALLKVESPVLYGEPEYIEERSITGVRAVHMVYQASALQSCTCGSCTTTRRSCD